MPRRVIQQPLAVLMPYTGVTLPGSASLCCFTNPIPPTLLRAAACTLQHPHTLQHIVPQGQPPPTLQHIVLQEQAG